jgi:hypothetical protein
VPDFQIRFSIRHFDRCLALGGWMIAAFKLPVRKKSKADIWRGRVTWFDPSLMGTMVESG